MDWLNSHLNWWTTTLACAAVIAIGYVVVTVIMDDIERNH